VKSQGQEPKRECNKKDGGSARRVETVFVVARTMAHVTRTDPVSLALDVAALEKGRGGLRQAWGDRRSGQSPI
jgi:hypothetical protein